MLTVTCCGFLAVVLTSCDFNQDSEPFCQFSQDTNDNSDWIRHQGPTPTPGTGPPGDYPDGGQDTFVLFLLDVTGIVSEIQSGNCVFLFQRASTFTTRATTCPTDRKPVCWARPSPHQPRRSASSSGTTCMAPMSATCWRFWQRRAAVRRKSGKEPVSRVHPGWRVQSLWPKPAIRESP